MASTLARRNVSEVNGEEGRPVARVETPRHLQVLEIGDDEIVGLVRDELDTERVAVYGLATGS